MKVFYVYIFFQFAILSLFGEKGQTGILKPEGSTQFTISNHSANYKKDSLLIIYDRFDRSGAGVVFRIYHPKKDHTVTIDDIPAGKYFVTIQWLGLHHDRFEKIVKVKKGKCEIIPITLQDAQEFSPSKVIIPQERHDWANLRVVAMK
jgi:hypothetical protein